MKKLFRKLSWIDYRGNVDVKEILIDVIITPILIVAIVYAGLFIASNS